MKSQSKNSNFCFDPLTSKRDWRLTFAYSLAFESIVNVTSMKEIRISDLHKFPLSVFLVLVFSRL